MAERIKLLERRVADDDGTLFARMVNLDQHAQNIGQDFFKRARVGILERHRFNLEWLFVGCFLLAVCGKAFDIANSETLGEDSFRNRLGVVNCQQRACVTC